MASANLVHFKMQAQARQCFR